MHTFFFPHVNIFHEREVTNTAVSETNASIPTSLHRSYINNRERTEKTEVVAAAEESTPSQVTK